MHSQRQRSLETLSVPQELLARNPSEGKKKGGVREVDQMSTLIMVT